MADVHTLRLRLPWIAVLVTLAAAVVLLLGPLWSSAEGENPLERARFGTDPAAVSAVIRMALPSVIVLASTVVAIAGRRHWWLGAMSLIVMGAAVLAGPSPLLPWFAPGLLLTAIGYAVSLRGPRAQPT